MPSATCTCGIARPYRDCCGRYFDDHAPPQTAEQLMRSRYSAYTRNRIDYLRATWHPHTCPHMLTPDSSTRWMGLRILFTVAGGPDDQEGVVEFVARYKIGGRAYRLHERSRFVRLAERWVYLDGEMDPGEAPVNRVD
jgi:SEC-C motif domain protein